MALQGAYRGNNDSTVRDQLTVMAFDVPEFLKAHIRSKSGFRDMNLGELDTHKIGDHRALTKGDIAEGACVHKNGLPFQRLNEIGLYRLQKPCCHSPCDFQIITGYRLATPIIGENDATESHTQIPAAESCLRR